MKLVDNIIRVIERFVIQILVVVISSIAAHADEPNPLGISFYGSFLHTEKVPNALFFFSEIKDEDSFELRKALRDHDVEIMVLSSEGGSVFEGLQMSGIIHDKGLSTYIPVESPFGEGNCASACSYMFFAGKTRIADGKLGVHQFASAKPDEKAEIGEIQSNAQFVVSEIAGFLGEYDVPAFVYPKMFQSTDMYYFKRSEMHEIERTQNEISRKDLTKIEEFIEEFKSALQKVASEEKEVITEAKDEVVEVIPETLIEPMPNLSELVGQWYFSAESSSQRYVKCTPLSVLVDYEYQGGAAPALMHKDSSANIILYQPQVGVSLARMQCREGGEFRATLAHFNDKPQRASFIVSETEFSIVGEVHYNGGPVGLTKLAFTRNKRPQKLPPFIVDKRLKHSTSTWKLTTSVQLSTLEKNCLNKLNEIKLVSRNTMLETDGIPYVGVRKDGLGAVVLLSCGAMSINEDKYKSLVKLNDYDFTIAATISHNVNIVKKVNLTFTHPNKSPIRKLTGRWYLKYDPGHGCYSSHSFFFEPSGSNLIAKSNNGKNIMLNEAFAEGMIGCQNGGSIKLMGSPSFKNEYSDFYAVAFICTLARECKTQRIAFSRVKSNQPKLPKTKGEQTQSYSAPKLTKKQQIKKAQKRLNQLGCEAGFADGVIGKRTKRALQRFNQANNKNLSANRLHELSSINTLNSSSKRCYIPPLEGNWTLSANSCQGYNITAKATLEHRSGNKYDFYYENNLGDVATGVLEDKKNIVRIQLNWTDGYSEIVNLNLSSSKKSVDGPWSNCWVTGRKN
jgi:peptidoglycan hydrolase-like protein with peptidoglycan-binding domain